MGSNIMLQLLVIVILTVIYILWFLLLVMIWTTFELMTIKQK